MKVLQKNTIYLNIIIYSVIILLIFPLAVMFMWSFARSWPWPYLLPQDFGLRGWKYFFNPTSKALFTLFLSVLLSLIVTIVTLVLSIPAAKSLAFYNFRGKAFFEIFILAPLIVPPIAVAMGIHVQFIKLGLADSFLGVVLVHLIPSLPYGIRILTNVFQAIGEKIELQARVLGANWWQAFIFVTLPLIAPGLVSVGSLIFIISFSQYFLTFLIGGGQVVTFPMLLLPYIQSGDRMMAGVFSSVFVLTALLFFIIVEKTIKSHYSSREYFYF
ncbi:MAG: putative spermidine/putrescine transport system permease protein [Clostridia bacterium]|jgi:putative spermidine/putrescine transport system permease protein|nr:binding-protein-dependent transport system inner rane component [Clostridiales bacterium]MDK2986293.1 putative spermidine/putrescine transport system permease protein [Clostridia bacterium]